MFAQLGSIIFEITDGFTSFEKSFGINYAQHDRINQKPRLQATGANLDTISFDIKLHRSFTNPENALRQIQTAASNLEILPLIFGNGVSAGNYVIESGSITLETTDAFGNIIEATISIQLLEAYTEELLRQAQRSAQNQAFATSQRNSNVRSVLPPSLSPAMAISADIKAVDSSGQFVSKSVTTVSQNPESLEYYSGKIDTSLDTAISGLDKIQAIMAGDFSSFNTPNVVGSINSVYTSIQNMKAVLPISDIGDFRNLTSAMQDSIRLLKTATSPLTNQGVIRRA